MQRLCADGGVDDAQQIGGLREIDHDLEQEAVELGLGQRIGPLHFEGILRGEHEEWLRKRARAISDADRALLHAFEQGRLRLGGGAIDLVGQHDVREDGTWLKAEDTFTTCARLRLVADDGRPNDIGWHQVWRKLDARKFERQRIRQRAYKQRLPQSRHAFEQHVSAREQCQQQFTDDALLTDYDGAELLLQ